MVVFFLFMGLLYSHQDSSPRPQAESRVASLKEHFDKRFAKLKAYHSFDFKKYFSDPEAKHYEDYRKGRRFLSLYYEKEYGKPSPVPCSAEDFVEFMEFNAPKSSLSDFGFPLPKFDSEGLALRDRFRLEWALYRVTRPYSSPNDREAEEILAVIRPSESRHVRNKKYYEMAARNLKKGAHVSDYLRKLLPYKDSDQYVPITEGLADDLSRIFGDKFEKELGYKRFKNYGPSGNLIFPDLDSLRGGSVSVRKLYRVLEHPDVAPRILPSSLKW